MNVRATASIVLAVAWTSALACSAAIGDTGCSSSDGGATATAAGGDGGDDGGGALDAAAADAAPAGIDCTPTATGAPPHLFCTGLYADWSTKALAPGVEPYDPGLRLWSDGAVKARWIALPPGAKIDTSNPDEWVFPVGTKLWKEFSVGGRRVETRLLAKRADGTWLRTVYLWSDDESAATELTTGVKDAGGTGYEVPSTEQCRLCHNGRIDGVLGFEAVSLASAQASGLTLAELAARQLVTDVPDASLAVPGNAVEEPALAWLHANCGTSCHNRSPQSQANFTGFYMRLEVAQLGAVADTDTVKTGVNYASAFQLPDGGALSRIAPHDLPHSAVVVRAGTRDPELKIQMPPLLTHVVDDAGVAAVSAWIQSM